MITLDLQAWTQITTINSQANHEISYLSDQRHYGVIDKWVIPVDNRGDCEDMSLSKQALLEKIGLHGDLALCWVWPGKKLHAVLLVDTDHGTLVLDNRIGEVVNWNDTYYKWSKRMIGLSWYYVQH